MLKLGLYNSDGLSDGVGAPVFRQFQAPAYNNVEPLTACLKKVEKEIIGCTHAPSCCLCAILHVLFLWINNLHQWSVREFSSSQGIDKRESPQRPPLGFRSAFFSPCLHIPSSRCPKGTAVSRLMPAWSSWGGFYSRTLSSRWTRGVKEGLPSPIFGEKKPTFLLSEVRD